MATTRVHARTPPSWRTSVGRFVRLHLLRAVRENASPGRTALGLGLGAFIGVFPTFSLGIPIAFFLSGRMGLNRAAAVGGAILAMNPVTATFLLPLSAWLGFEIFDQQRIEAEASSLMSYFTEYGPAFLVGNTLVALAVALLFTSLMFFVIRRKGGLKPLLIRPKQYRPRTPRPPSDSGSAQIPTGL